MKMFGISYKSFSEVIIQAFITESRQGYKMLAVFLAMIFVILSVLLLNMGAPPINAIPWDVMILLDGGWRIINGQIPHTDYYNPIGSLTYLLVALGMKVTQPAAAAITYGNVLAFIVLTPWAWLIARHRLSVATAFLFVLFIGILLVAPRALGFSARWTTYAMLYNRQAFALYAMLLLELFVPRHGSIESEKSKAFDLLSGLSSGLLLALLLFCKITYFGFGVFAILIHALIFKFSRAWVLALVSSFLSFCLVMQLVFQVNLIDYFTDIIFAGHAQSALVRWFKLRESFLRTYPQIYLFFLFLAILPINFTMLKDARKVKVLQRSGVWIISIFLMASSLLICAGNAQEGQEIPTYLVAGLIVFEYFRRNFEISNNLKNEATQIKYFASLFILIPFLGGTILFKDIASIAHSIGWHKSQASSVEVSQRFQSKTLYDFVIPEDSDAITAYWKAKDVPGRINDGLALLRKYVSDDSRIFAMGYANPFPFALGLQSPKLTALWWDKNYSFNEEVYPASEKVFEDVNMVIIPQVTEQDPGCCLDTLNLMKEIYSDYLNRNFIERDQSKFWTLLMRRNGVS